MGDRILRAQRLSGLFNDGVACGAITCRAGVGRRSYSSSSAIGTPSALATRQTSATVGLVWLRSICESIEPETPELLARSSRDRPRAVRKAFKVAPTQGGSFELARRMAFMIAYEPYNIMYGV